MKHVILGVVLAVAVFLLWDYFSFKYRVAAVVYVLDERLQKLEGASIETQNSTPPTN